MIESLCQVKYGKTVELHIHHLITHGSTVQRKDPIFDDRKRLAFCNVYRFSAGKAAKIKRDHFLYNPIV